MTCRRLQRKGSSPARAETPARRLRDPRSLKIQWFALLPRSRVKSCSVSIRSRKPSRKNSSSDCCSWAESIFSRIWPCSSHQSQPRHRSEILRGQREPVTRDCRCHFHERREPHHLPRIEHGRRAPQRRIHAGISRRVHSRSARLQSVRPYADLR
jgi:hypothetical protein